MICKWCDQEMTDPEVRTCTGNDIKCSGQLISCGCLDEEEEF